MRILAFFLTLIFSVAACAQEAPAPAPEFVEGTHYFKIPSPVKTASDKVQVHEFFSYSCGHCYHFEKPIHEWTKTLPAGAELVKSPAQWSQSMALYAKVYFTGKALGIEKEVNSKFFSAIFDDRKQIRTEADIQNFFVGLGIDAAKFKSVFNSFSVENQASIADARARGVPITGTPELLVDGKYRITAGSAGSHEGMLKVASFLVAKILAEKK